MRLRLIRFAGLIGCSLLAAAACRTPPPNTPPKPAAAGTYPFQSATFNSSFQQEGGASLSSRYWLSPQGILKEITRGGKVSFVLRHAGRAYEWDPESHEGRQGISSGVPRLSGEPDTMEVLQGLPEAFKPGNFQFLGYEDLEGMRTAKYAIRTRNPLLRVVTEGTVWLHPERAFPVKYVNRGVGGHYQIVNSRIVFDPSLPPEFFTPPSDVHFKSVDRYLKK